MNYFYSIFRLSTQSDIVFLRFYIPFLVFGLGGIFNLMLVPFGLDLKSALVISSTLALFYTLAYYFFFGFKIDKRISSYSFAKIYFLRIAFFIAAILVEFGSFFLIAYYNKYFYS